jgi:hypothetical protein
LYSIFNSSVFRDMTFLLRFELVVILDIHTYLNMGARPSIYVAQIYNRLKVPQDFKSDVFILRETLTLLSIGGKQRNNALLSSADRRQL